MNVIYQYNINHALTLLIQRQTSGGARNRIKFNMHLVMSIGVTVVCGFAGGVISQCAKSLVDYIWSLDIFVRQRVVQNLDSEDEPINLDENNIIRNDPFIKSIVSKLSGNNFGLFVLGCPAGTGKSTLIQMTLDSIKSRRPLQRLVYWKFIKNGDLVLQNQSIHECLKIPSHQSLSDYLPFNSCIILDQIDVMIKESLDYSFRRYITHLATDAFNSQKYKIVMCVSDPLVAKTIQYCNGGEKIHPLCDNASLVWSDAQLDNFIRFKLPNLNSDDIEKLYKLAQSCRNSPGLIVKAYSLYVDNVDGVIQENKWEKLRRYSDDCNKSWREFDEI